MRKRFEAITETERKKGYKGEANRKVKGGFPKPRSGLQWTTGLKIEMHQQQIGNKF